MHAQQKGRDLPGVFVRVRYAGVHASTAVLSSREQLHGTRLS